MKFSQLNIKTFDVLFHLILFVGGSITVIILLPGKDPMQAYLFAIMLLLAPVFIMGPGLISTVTIDEGGISIKGLFKRQQYTWQQVKSARVYRMKLYTWTQVEQNQLDKLGFTRIGFVFVSTERNFWPAKGNNPGVMKFHYRKEAYQLIAQYMNQHSAQTVVAD